MPQSAPGLDLILAHDGGGHLHLWACRGTGKGCHRNKFRASKANCEDCMGPLPSNMTLEEVQRRLAAGDA